MLLMGFKADWNKDWGRAREYLNIWNQVTQGSLDRLKVKLHPYMWPVQSCIHISCQPNYPSKETGNPHLQ